MAPRKGPEHISDVVPKTTDEALSQEAREAGIRRYTADELKALKPEIDAEDHRTERQKRREERVAARRERREARSWRRGQRVSDEETRYKPDEEIDDAGAKRFAEIGRQYAETGHVFEPIAVGYGPRTVTGEERGLPAESGRDIDEETEYQTNKAYAGRGLSTAEGGGMTYINEETGMNPSPEDIARQRMIAKREAEGRGEKFNEDKFMATYYPERYAQQREARLAQNGRKGRVEGAGADAKEASDEAKKQAAEKIAQEQAEREK